MHDAHSFNAATRALMLAYGRPARAVSARATLDFLRAGRREGVPDGWPSERRRLSTHAHFFEGEREQFSRRRRKGAGKAPRSPALQQGAPQRLRRRKTSSRHSSLSRQQLVDAGAPSPRVEEEPPLKRHEAEAPAAAADGAMQEDA